jgi:flagellar hook-basal body complex protein FliE
LFGYDRSHSVGGKPLMPQRIIQLRRWQVGGAFVVLILSFFVMGIFLKDDSNNNHRAIIQLKQAQAKINETQKRLNQTQHRLIHDKASIHALEVTDCKLHTFLLSSAKLRQGLAKSDTDPVKRKKDMKAAKVSLQLANSFRNELCPAKVTEIR